MGAYSLDRSSPKKGLPRSGFVDMKRKLSSRRYLCLWVLVALVPCYVLRQMFFYQSPETSAFIREPVDERVTTLSSEKTSSERTIAYDKPTEVKVVKEKSVLDFIFNPSTIKPAKYDGTPSKKGQNATQNSLKLKLKDNFEDDEDFGVAEDNDKVEEQMWTAPPSPVVPK